MQLAWLVVLSNHLDVLGINVAVCETTLPMSTMLCCEQNESSVVQSLDNSLQRQLSIDLSNVSSPTDLITKLQLFNIDLVGFARENVGLFLSVCVCVQVTTLLEMLGRAQHWTTLCFCSHESAPQLICIYVDLGIKMPTSITDNVVIVLPVAVINYRD